jgi:DNA-binding XRE family transcriptional regulator
MNTQTLSLSGKPYVVVEKVEYERLVALAEAASVPPLPEPDRHGNYPAVEYGCATIARGIIRDRLKAGLNQKQLAALAGIRVETLCRIETGRHLPSVPTVDKIDKALKNALGKGRTPQPKAIKGRKR